MTGFGLATMAGAVAALAEAARAALTDRRTEGSGARARRPVLIVLGRRVVGIAPVLARRPRVVTGDRAGHAAAAAGLEPGDVEALRGGALVAFTGLGAGALLVVGGLPGMLIAVLAAGFGVAYADLWLRAVDRARRERIERAAPAFLDLAAAAVAAGVNLDAALAGARCAVSGPLADELDLAQANMELGHPRRAELRDLAERTGSQALAGLALAVSLSDRLGVPVADALRRQARRARADRARAVSERAAAAGPRVLVVVVFVLVPAAMLPLAAAVGLSVAGAVTGP
ncbi:MAG: type II secretion system F family protein [Gaiellales bacterium]